MKRYPLTMMGGVRRRAGRGFTLVEVLLGLALLGLLAGGIFAVQRGALAGEAALDLSRLDEAFTEERWGVDEEAAVRTAAHRAEATLLQRWFEALC